MKAMQKFIQLSLTVTILLAAMGFRVNIPHCSHEKDAAYSLFAKPDCCCGKDAESNSQACNDMACVTQQGTSYPVNQNTTSQQTAKFFKAPITYPGFAARIRPAILATIPHFTLPPPISGRFIRILHQTFII